MEDQPQKEHQPDQNQRNRRADERRSGAHGDDNGVVHGEVSRVALEPDGGGGEGGREVEGGNGGEELRPGAAAREGGGEVLRRSGEDVEAGDRDCGVGCGGGGGHFGNRREF